MKNLSGQLILLLFAFPLVTACSDGAETSVSSSIPMDKVKVTKIKLPKPHINSGISLEESLYRRRSIRNFSSKPLELEEAAQMLWAAQGITADWGGRTAPSAGALYPLEIYLIAGNVKALTPGIYRYDPNHHEIIMMSTGDVRPELYEASLDQNAIREGAINLIFTAVYHRTTRKYGERGRQYVHMETGHAAQNVCLQAAAMDLGAVTIGAFENRAVAKILNLTNNQIPLYIIPVGKKLE